MHHRHEHHHDHRHIGRHFLERLSAHLPWHAMGRHHGDHDGGHGRQGGFGGFGEGDGFTRGRKFTSQDLQLLLLALLADKPAHGYELIKALETRSNGFYTPSPGMVYPALTYLEELGYVTVALETNRKCYALADAGREYLAANQERVNMMLSKLEHIARKMDSIRRAYSGEQGEEMEGAGDLTIPELLEARWALKSALMQCKDASIVEQRRIADVLRQATRSILGK
jgi:DNA-binding PadR family transcriptional regulator